MNKIECKYPSIVQTVHWGPDEDYLAVQLATMQQVFKDIGFNEGDKVLVTIIIEKT